MLAATPTPAALHPTVRPAPLTAVPDPTCVRLVDVEPDLAADLHGDGLAIARRHLVVPGLNAPLGAWSPGPAPAACMAVLLVSGMVVRDGVVLDRPDVELYGPGDADIVARRFSRTIREFGYEF